MSQPSRKPRRQSHRRSRLQSRRTFLQISSGAAIAAFAGCVGGQSGNSTRTTTEATTETTANEPETQTTEETDTIEDADADLPEHAIWKLELDEKVRLGPALLDGTLYVGGSSGVFRALDPEDGTERWQFDTGASFFSGTGADYSPVLVDDTLYAVSGDRGGAHGDNFAAYAIDAETGEELWSVEESWPSFLSLFGVADGKVFVGTSDDALSGRGETLLALDAETGEEAWTAEIGDARGAAVTANAVYVAATSRLDGFDATDGSRRWTRELDGRVLGPEVGDGVVYAGYHAGRESGAVALDPESGETRWTVEDRFVSSLAADESLYVGGEHVAKFAPDGTERWKHEDGGLLSDGALVGDALLVSGNPVAKLSTDDGTEQWRSEVDAELGTVEGTDERVVAVQRENGTVLDVFGAETGELRFTFDVGGEWLRGVAVESGTVYAGSDEGVVYALRG